MDTASKRRWLQGLLGAVTLGSMAAVVSAWVTAGNSPFTLPPAHASNPPVWMPTKGASRVAVRVTTAGGKTVVKAGASSASNAVVGSVPANTSAVFEGTYGYLNIEADATGSATGSWDARQPDGASSSNQMIGSGSVTLPLPSGATGFFFYGNDAPVCRVATVQAGPQPVSVVDGQQTTLATLEGGDWTCCVRTVRKYGLMAPSGTSSWMIADVPTGPDAFAWQYAGVATAQAANDEDRVSLDGTASVVVTLTNTSAAGTIVVTSTGGSQPNPATIGPGQQASCSGTLTGFSWVYAQAGMSAGIVVRKQ